MSTPENKLFLIGLARAFGGAVLFSFPLLMTMEMWWLGFYMDPIRLAIFVFLSVPLLAILSYYAGFEKTNSWKENLLNAFSAFAIAAVVSIIVLFLFGIIGPNMSAEEIIGKIAVQSVPASIGAMISGSPLEGNTMKEDRRNSAGYAAGLFLLAIGALYLSLSLAATEEMILISFKMNEWHILGLLFFSLLMMQGFIYAILAKNKGPVPEGRLSFWSVFYRFTVVGYTLTLLIVLYILWTFGRTDDMTIASILKVTIVLGFPAALGAGSARLIL